MNKIILTGSMRNIQYSHTTNDTEYYKAEFLVKDSDIILPLKFKKLSNPFTEGQLINIEGTIRSKSSSINGKNKVDIYVFTYFDQPQDDLEESDIATVDGRICKIDPIRKTKSDKDIIHFILANNITTSSAKINNYVPITAWGKLAKSISKLEVGTKLEISGVLKSRLYNKILENGDIDIRTAYELVISDYEIRND